MVGEWPQKHIKNVLWRPEENSYSWKKKVCWAMYSSSYVEKDFLGSSKWWNRWKQLRERIRENTSPNTHPMDSRRIIHISTQLPPWVQFLKMKEWLSVRGSQSVCMYQNNGIDSNDYFAQVWCKDQINNAYQEFCKLHKFVQRSSFLLYFHTYYYYFRVSHSSWSYKRK